ncbi:hypothetical protein CRE_27592 [Caenorhabditis remanei]|uniref:Uncharacterized protein n=2 Tax=Caenorhabditis remanei TaxID=31234 RepID=E3MKD8_CAERE|nr:hypothetical protein CRE_27592 [Caenorhabditis remanei]
MAHQKINPIVAIAKSVKNKPNHVVVNVKSPEDLQKEYATAHKATGREVAAFVFVVVLIVCGFFAATKFM